ncbi:MAG: hypothetical protein JXB26_04925 [Candidatus Aminicenantes bacterium]|nr:hypothetical protein [Candidatus Aminicenantes bacterium]
MWLLWIILEWRKKKCLYLILYLIIFLLLLFVFTGNAEVTDKNFEEKVDTFINAHGETKGFSGSILMAKEGKVNEARLHIQGQTVVMKKIR